MPQLLAIVDYARARILFADGTFLVVPASSTDSTTAQCPPELAIPLAASVTEKYRGKFAAVTGLLQCEDTREPAMFLHAIASTGDVGAAEIFLDCFIKEWKEAAPLHVAQAWLQASFTGKLLGVNIDCHFPTQFQVMLIACSGACARVYFLLHGLICCCVLLCVYVCVCACVCALCVAP